VRSIGLDVHRDFCEVAILDACGGRARGRIATTPADLELFARSLGPDDRVALEVTGNAWEIARIIEPHVARVIVVSPSDTGIRQARAKTDRLDAIALAKLLAAGSLDALWMPDERTRVMRRRLSRRAQLVTARTRVKNEVHAVLVRVCRADRRPATCSASRAAVGWPSSSCPSRSARPSTPGCATSTSSPARSPSSSA
jgi:transposase